MLNGSFYISQSTDSNKTILFLFYLVHSPIIKIQTKSRLFSYYTAPSAVCLSIKVEISRVNWLYVTKPRGVV